ncbi:MAG: N4-gp56 family major capsid protein, partial [Oscillospiraceae bacterium]|nr:N4-gp56 family major capsid protein [Oscillospiraceae bacterium]
MAINLAKKADPKVLERFKLGSVTEGIFSNRYKWTGVATVQVYSVDTVELGDYNKALNSGPRFGTLTELGDTMQEM